jgi:hypothetical protein
MVLTLSNSKYNLLEMFMKMKDGHIRMLKACLILVLFFSIFPEVVFSQEDIYNNGEIDSVSTEGTNSCDEHNCPVLPDEPFHHCAVCCVISHFFTNQLTGINFHFDNPPQAFSMAEDVPYKELFAKTLFRPPQSTL